MSARRPRLLGRFLKWFVVPVALAALGVFVVGPHLVKRGIPWVDRFKEPAKPAPQPVAPKADGPELGEPEVEVTVQPSSRRTVGSSHRRRRRRT